MEPHDPGRIYSLLTAERARNETLQAELIQLYKSLKLVQHENNSMVSFLHFIFLYLFLEKKNAATGFENLFRLSR